MWTRCCRFGLTIAAALMLIPASTITADAEAKRSETSDEESSRPKGKKERRAERFKRLIDSFEGDKRIIYDLHGFPSFRYRERENDRLIEHWVYVTERLEFVFADGVLTHQR